MKAQFDAHFVKRRNIIYECAKFNQCKQEEGEPVDTFITALYSLAEHCGYGSLHDEMIRDRIVVGIHNSQLSVKLQLVADLTLEMAITRVRQAEVVKQQQPLLRPGSGLTPDTPVGAIRASTTTKPGYSGKQPFKDRPRPHQPENSCSWCGKTPTHGRRLCPAKEAICSKCHKKGHYAAVCRSAVRIGEVQTSDNPADMHDVFIGAVVGRMPKHSNPWTAMLNLNGTPTELQIDTGAEVTVIPESVWKQIGLPILFKSGHTLRGPDKHVLEVKGRFTTELKFHDK